MLLTTIDQLKVVIPNLDIGFDNLTYFESYRNTAERWLKREILGESLYNHLNEASSPTGEIYSLCRKAIGLHTFLNAQPDLDVVQTANGLGVVNNQNVSPASQERIRNLRDNLQNRLDVAVEDLIEFLEGDTGTLRDKWQGSTAHEKLFETLVYSTRDFSEYYDLQDNRTLFLNIKQDIKTIERTVIARKLSDAFLDEIRTAQKNGSIPDHIAAILDDLKYAVALFALTRALYQEKIMIRNRQAVMAGKIDPSERVAIRNVRKTLYLDAHQFFDDVLTHLNSNIDQYDTYAASAEYERQTYSGWENEDDDPIFVSP